MDDTVIALLQASRIFSSLDDEAWTKLLAQFEQMSIAQGATLFSQGDQSADIYLLATGKLAAELTTNTGETKIVGYIEPGETVGESGVLSGEPRSLSVKALKDSTLLRLSTQSFLTLCHEYPAVLFAIIHPMITRTAGLIRILSPESRNKHIVIAPANQTVALATFAQRFSDVVAEYPNIILVTDYQAEFSAKNIDSAVVREKIQQLTADKKSVQRVIYIVKSFDSVLAKIAFKRADTLYIAADAQGEPKIDHHILDKISSKWSHAKARANLILLHPLATDTPKNTAQWLAQTEFNLYHHVRLDVKKDLMRLLRFIRGKAVGVVLGGGGTRGWAHLGALKAISEAKIPIDMIGGTSVGALIAACYAESQSYEVARAKFYAMVLASQQSISWRGLTWPAISMFDAKKFTLSQIEAFGQQTIENLWLPYFCISSNLANQSEVVHRQGLVWEKIRASTAIPGIMPPMLLDGQIHLDGGLLNNLPVDCMRAFVGSKGRIIAVQLNGSKPDDHQYEFPPILTFWDTFLAKIGLGKKRYKFPHFLDVFMQGLFLGSTLRVKQNSLAANLFVNLNLSEFKMLHANPEEGDRLIEVGYRETMKQIQLSRSKKIRPLE